MNRLNGRFHGVLAGHDEHGRAGIVFQDAVHGIEAGGFHVEQNDFRLLPRHFLQAGFGVAGGQDADVVLVDSRRNRLDCRQVAVDHEQFDSLVH